LNFYYLYNMRYLIYIAFCLLANSGLFAQTEQLAQNYLEQGEYEKALNTYRDLLKEDPEISIFSSE